MEIKWTFYASGFFAKHLPDEYIGEVVLADVDPPPEVQGVWWFNPDILDWQFWIPKVGGDLATLGGGHSFNYMVLVNGPCEWEITITPSTTNYYLMLPREELLAHLTSGAIANDWAKLPPSVREELAEKIVNLWS